jgi:hypothetical protein
MSQLFGHSIGASLVGGVASPQGTAQMVLEFFNILLQQSQLPFKIDCLHPAPSSHLQIADCHHSIHIIQTYEQPKTDSESF